MKIKHCDQFSHTLASTELEFAVSETSQEILLADIDTQADDDGNCRALLSSISSDGRVSLLSAEFNFLCNHM